MLYYFGETNGTGNVSVTYFAVAFVVLSVYKERKGLGRQNCLVERAFVVNPINDGFLALLLTSCMTRNLFYTSVSSSVKWLW